MNGKLNDEIATLFKVFSVTCVIMSFALLGHMLGYINDQQAHHQCNLMTLYVSVLTDVLALICSIII